MTRGLLAAVLAVLFPIASMAVDVVSKRLDPSSALAQQAVRTARPVFERDGPHIEDYEIVVFQRKSADGTPLNVGVLFRDPDTPAMVGSSEEYPSYEVELNADATLVLNSHYSR